MHRKGQLRLVIYRERKERDIYKKRDKVKEREGEREGERESGR